MYSHKRSINTSDLAVPSPEKHRGDLLGAYRQTLSQLDSARLQMADVGDTVSNDLMLFNRKLADRAAELRDEYRDGVPFVEVSRCPISGQMLRRSLDIYGLDGLWWDNTNPIRPREQRSTTLLAFTGAMKLSDEPEFTSFLVKPGPGVPFVIPRLLSNDGVKAVLSCLLVSGHIGYVVAYFADPLPQNIQRANDWGREDYQILRKDGETGWDKCDEIEDDYDFGIEQWIDLGKLLWIAPGDSDLKLRRGSKECPYIDLDGIREIQRLKEGELWYPSLVREHDDTNRKG